MISNFVILLITAAGILTIVIDFKTFIFILHELEMREASRILDYLEKDNKEKN